MDQMKRVTKARLQLVTDSPFFGVLALHLDMQEARHVDTMATDGKRLLVNPEFAGTLTDSELRGVLAHEVYHCAADHMGRLGKRELKLWNVAADYAINQELVAAGFTLPKGALLDSKWHGMTAESIYGELEREERRKRQKQGGGGNGSPQSGQNSQGSGGSGNGAPQGQSQGSGAPSPSQATGAAGNGSGGNDPGKCGGILPAPAGEAAEQSRQWKARAIQAAAIAARQAGSVPGGIARMIQEARKPVISWREALRRHVTESISRDYSWSRPNRRFIAGGLYLPSLVSDGRGRVVIGIDTSGSIDDSALAAFRGELQSLLDDKAADCLTVIYCDTEITGIQEFESGDVLKLDPKGGGGTAFKPVLDWTRQNGHGAACLVYFTDLECWGEDFGSDPGVPVIWANWSRPRGAPFGEVLQIDPHA